MTKPCLIIGNGPSYNEMPARAVDAWPSFGMNYAGFQPTYYVCIDSDILTKHADEIRPLVEGAKIAYLSGLLPGVELLKMLNVFLVTKDTQSFKAEEFMSGFTATYVALKEAYYLGFDEVHLWGIDHSPRWEHYRDDYRIGVVTTPARMRMIEQHYQLAMNVYARAGRTIINHSHPSALDKIFRRAK